MLEYLICALRNLGRKKLRTALTLSGIAIGVASVLLIGAVGTGGTAAVENELNGLGINGLNIQKENTVDGTSTAAISDDDVRACLSVSGVKEAMPVIMQSGFSVMRGLEKNTLFWGVDTDAGQVLSIHVRYGTMFAKSDIEKRALVCLVDDNLAKSVYKRENITGKKITVYLGSGYRELTVKGVVASGVSMLYNLVGDYIPSFVYLPYTTAQDLRGQIGYDEIAVRTDSNSDIDRVGSRIVSRLSAQNTGQSYLANNMFKQKERLSRVLDIVTLIITAVGAISLVVAGLGIMTIMTVSVSERTREIGIKKAIGARSSLILLEFLFEAASLSLLGGLIGTVLSLAVAWAASFALQMDFAVKVNSVLFCLFFSLLVGVLFGVYPASKAARLKPVDALRQE